MDMAEQAALVGRPERRAAPELPDPADVVEQRRGEQQVGAQPRVQLRGLARQRRHADRVLEQAARVGVVRLGGRQLPQRRRISASPRSRATTAARPGCETSPRGTRESRRARRRRGASAARGRPDRRRPPRPSGSRAAAGRRSSRRARARARRRPRQSARRAARRRSRSGPRSVRSGRRARAQVGRALPRRPPLLAGDRVDALDRAVGGQLGDRAHGTESRPQAVGTLAAMAVVKPFRALRYDEAVAGAARDARRAALRRDLARAA